MQYEGPRRDWKTSDPAQLREQLDLLVQELDRMARALSAAPLRLERQEIVISQGAGTTVSAGVALDHYLPIQTEPAGTINVKLPAVGTSSARLGGHILGVLRLSASGTVNLYPTGGSTINGATGITPALASGIGLYLFFFTGGVWFSVRT